MMGWRARIRAWVKGQSRKPWAIAVLRILVAGYMWTLYASARKRVVIPRETQALIDQKTPMLVGNWHGRLFLIAPFWQHKIGLPLCVISSPHADGLIVGGAAEVLGIRALRGTRGGQGGGAKVMREGLRALKDGSCLILNPDGPNGPRQVLGSGAAALAQLSGVPFVAITYSGSAGRILMDKWDRGFMARYFSKLTFAVSAPLYFDKDQDRESIRQQIETVMNEQLWDIDAIYGRPKIEPD